MASSTTYPRSGIAISVVAVVGYFTFIECDRRLFSNDDGDNNIVYGKGVKR